jgi:hypothetical protein
MRRFKRIVTTDRRIVSRIPASKVVPKRITKLASGQEVNLVNIGLNGTILIKCAEMLSPGASIRLKLQIPGAAISLEGRIQRCRVINLNNDKIMYEAAIILDGGLPKLLADILEQQKVKNLSPETDRGLKKLPKIVQLWVADMPEATAQV